MCTYYCETTYKSTNLSEYGANVGHGTLTPLGSYNDVSRPNVCKQTHTTLCIHTYMCVHVHHEYVYTTTVHHNAVCRCGFLHTVSNYCHTVALSTWYWGLLCTCSLALNKSKHCSLYIIMIPFFSFMTMSSLFNGRRASRCTILSLYMIKKRRSLTHTHTHTHIHTHTSEFFDYAHFHLKEMKI